MSEPKPRRKVKKEMKNKKKRLIRFAKEQEKYYAITPPYGNKGNYSKTSRKYWSGYHAGFADALDWVEK